MTCIFTSRPSALFWDGCDLPTPIFPGTPELRIASKKIVVRVSIDGLFALSCTLTFICPFGACLCHSAVHATNLAAPQDLTVQDAAMFSCCHVFNFFQVFTATWKTFSCMFSFAFLFLKTLLHVQGHGGLILATPTKLWMQTGRARRRVSLYLQKAGAPEPARLETAFDFQTGRFSGLPIFCRHTDPQSIDIHLALLINKAGSLGAPATLPSKLCVCVSVCVSVQFCCTCDKPCTSCRHVSDCIFSLFA